MQYNLHADHFYLLALRAGYVYKHAFIHFVILKPRNVYNLIISAH